MTDEPREYTKEEILENFHDHVREMIRYWDTIKLNPRDMRHGETDQFVRISGVAHSILAMLDGCTLSLPAFMVVPCPADEDKEYHQKQGENWYPPAPTDESIVDIGGVLRDFWNRRK